MLPVETPGLGNRSYLVHDGETALVVDPPRDHDRILDVAVGAGVGITCVAESHIHNDYVTGGYRLARAVGADYLVNADDPVSFERRGVRDGDVVEVGRTRVRVLHTPGHTPTHLSYAVEQDGGPVAVFTGGSLLYGSTGRPDLCGPAHTEPLARAQWRSARRLAQELPDATALYPTHGFGSFCSASPASGTAGTIGDERSVNRVLIDDCGRWVRTLLEGLDVRPAYYDHMAPINLAGPVEVDLAPPPQAGPAEVRRRIEAGQWVVDVRAGHAFATEHVAGSVNIALDGQFATYLGWLMPWGASPTVLAESSEDVARAQREMVRIGIERPAAMATGTPRDWAPGALGSFARATFADLAAAFRGPEPPSILDVRRDSERLDGRIAGSVGVPIHEVLGRLDDLPDGPLWIHCAGGFRAAVAASLLDARGYEVVAVDDAFDRAGPAGVPIVTGREGLQQGPGGPGRISSPPCSSTPSS